MESKTLQKLKIDEQFKNLISPLRPKEYETLEKNLIADGCREPLTIWDGYVVDGHNRYEICTRHNIPFAVVEKDFSCREEALAWICANQLGRRNISDETRRFLIGKQYEAEKIAGRIKNPTGINQYNRDGVYSRNYTADRIAHESKIARATVEKYAAYSRAMDALAEKDPQLASGILAGQYKVSHENVVALSKMKPSEIKTVERKIQKMEEPFVQFHKIRRVLSSAPRRVSKKGQGPSVKDMPAFDPDADINGLTLTIPSWSSSIERVLTKTNLSIVSEKARTSLEHELCTLTKYIDDLLSAIKEG